MAEARPPQVPGNAGRCRVAPIVRPRPAPRLRACEPVGYEGVLLGEIQVGLFR